MPISPGAVRVKVGPETTRTCVPADPPSVRWVMAALTSSVTVTSARPPITASSAGPGVLPPLQLAASLQFPEPAATQVRVAAMGVAAGRESDPARRRTARSFMRVWNLSAASAEEAEPSLAVMGCRCPAGEPWAPERQPALSVRRGMIERR